MTALVYFLNHKEFKSKDGTKTYRVLTVCDAAGDVSEYFHENENHNYNSFSLFQLISLELSVNIHHGKPNVKLISACSYEEEEEED